MEKEKLELIAEKVFEKDFELYQVIDFLNRNLKDKGIILGLSKEKEKIKISIYKTE